VARPIELDQCLRGKHDFGAWYNPSTVPQVDEFFRFRCRVCGCWMWRSGLEGYDVEQLRKTRNRIKWERSSEQDVAARYLLQARKAEAARIRAGVLPEDPPGAHSNGERILTSTGSPGVDSPRSRGVRSAGSRPRPRKAVRRG
jgi:hypothetical protein